MKEKATRSDLENRFLDLLENHFGILVKIARMYTRTWHDREDLIQAMILELWNSFPGFKGNAKASTWMYRVALNTAMTRHRRDKRGIPLRLEEHISEAGPTAWTPEDEPPDELDRLWDAIGDLDAFNRALILLYLDGLSHEEIAQITGLSRSNVGTRIGRVKEKLKDFITKQTP
ncbi:MAG: RNA polymerase sigma factor [Bacteroidales bacterium]